MADWRERLRETIKLTSPDGNVFEGKFQSSTINRSKKLGIFRYAKVRGATVQDLDVDADTHSWTVIFDGVDNDKESKRMLDALDENGRWTIIHPVLGNLTLQPVGFGMTIDPVGSGNVTGIDTEWIKANPDLIIKSASQLGSEIGKQKDSVNAQSASQFEKNVKQDTAGEKESLKSSVNKGVASFKKTIKTLSDKSSEISNQVNSIVRGIQDTLDETIIPVLALAGQVQNLIELPALISQDFETRIESYKDLAAAIFEQSPENSTIEGKNEVAVQELFLTSTLSTSALIGSTSELQTRGQAIVAITDLQDLFSNTIDNLDASMVLFSTNDIDEQYFSQSESFNDTYLIMSLALAFLLLSTFNLQKEKRFIIANPENTWIVAIREYTKTGAVNQDNTDLFFDIFISINKLKGDELFLLPAGFEAVVYVG